MTRRLRPVLTAALLVFLWIVPLTAAGGPTALPAWGTEPSPNAGFPRNVLEGVDAVSPTDAWAVGGYEANGFLHPRPLVERWNGSEWSSVEVPWNQEGELFGVAALASDNVWMVGGNQDGGQAVIAHWNGSALSLVPHPNPGPFNRLYAVTALAANDVWAVGEYTNSVSRTFTLHWDGSSWTHVPSPSGSGYNHLYGVTALASNDVWAVGDDGTNTLTLHWNGSQWTRVPASSTLSGTLRSVSAAPDGTVWAVGDSGPSSLTLRWNGTSWARVPSPSPGRDFLDLNGVVSISSTNAWAVGYYDFSGNWKTLTMHWDGSSWSVVNSPSPDPTLNLLSGVTALSGSDVWAVGNAGATGTLALHRTGATWERATTANEGSGTNVLNGISAASPNDIWAVGHAQNQSLTLHYDGSAWTVIPSPNLEYGVRLEDVVAISATDVWAVGWSGANFDYTNVAMHWDGTAWSIVPTPQPGGELVDQLFAIDAVAPNDVWATGVYWPTQADQSSQILHWNGQVWSVVTHNCDVWGGLTGATAISATDAWAVGDATTCHYDGTFWTEVPSPQPRIEYYEIAYPLEDVSALSPTDVWAVGARVLDGPFEISWQAIVEHWNGVEWMIDRAQPGHVYYGVEALSPNDVWAVGTDSYGPLIVHFDGSGWSTVPTPEWGRGGRLAGIDSAENQLTTLRGGPTTNLWAAGNYFPGNTPSRTLIQRAPSPTQGAVVGGSNVAQATISWFGPENGSTETDSYGNYEVGGLLAGTYTFIATNPGCVPDSASVTVIAGQTLRQDFHIGCGRASSRSRAKAKRAITRG
jgi:hypothetical protein